MCVRENGIEIVLIRRTNKDAQIQYKVQEKGNRLVWCVSKTLWLSTIRKIHRSCIFALQDHLAQLHFRLTKTRPDTLPATLFKTFNKSLALSNLHPSTLDYHTRHSLHQLHIDPLAEPLPHMVTLPHKSSERAYRNILRTTIKTLWQMDLFNQAHLHLPHTNCRDASYIHIARDDLQRRDLFKPAQYLRSHIDQLPLLRLRTQATSYIPSHLHLANDHTAL